MKMFIKIILIIVLCFKFETVWQWIPNNLKLSDATLLFSTRKNGFSLANLYQTCLPFENNSIIILIKNDYKWVFFNNFIFLIKKFI